MKRFLDATLAAVALAILSPVIALAALGILFCDGCPVLYRASRMGRNGHRFTMYKFRTMRTNQGRSPSRITAPNDSRTFPFGALLRNLKIDELPQLVNIIMGEMSFIGPRPEDPYIVRKYYTLQQLQILRVRPGLASPGTLYEYACGESALCSGDAEASYVKNVLPKKLAFDLAYIREASLSSDLRLVLLTLRLIFAMASGRTTFAAPPEMKPIGRVRAPSPDISSPPALQKPGLSFRESLSESPRS